MSRSPAFRCAAVTIALAGCASAQPVARTLSPGEVAGLETAVRADSTNATALTRLGSAYLAVNRPADARRVLARAAARTPRDAGTAFLLALATDESGDLAAARRLYANVLTLDPTPTLRAQTNARLQLLARRELVAAAQQALADERRLTTRAPERGTIAVFPFLYDGKQPDLEPLGRAMSEFLVTDLSQTNRLRVLERARVQALLDEMKLASSGLVDPATAARSGRLLRAARVVQGRINGTPRLLTLQAALVAVADSSGLRRGPLQEAASAPRLFEAEKRLALDVYGGLGIQLTDAEVARVGGTRTTSLAALLEFGRGLEAEDAGLFAEARRHFTESARLDPAFGAAREHEQAAAQLALAAGLHVDAGLNLASAEAGGAGARGPSSVDVFTGIAREPVLGVNVLPVLLPDPSPRDPLPEALGRESLAARARLQVILVVP